MIAENKAVALKWLAALGTGDADVLKTLMTDDIEAIATGTSVASGTRRFKEIVMVCTALSQISKSGLNPKILNVTAEDDRVAVEWEGNCALVNGKEYNNQYHMLFFVRDGKIYKVKEYFCTKLADAVMAPFMPA